MHDEWIQKKTKNNVQQTTVKHTPKLDNKQTKDNIKSNKKKLISIHLQLPTH